MKKDSKSHEVNRALPYLRLAACAIFYLIFAFISGPVIGADSRGYIEMISAREPVYPILLWIFRKLLGNDIYLWAVVIFQNLLMAFAVWYCTEKLWKRYCSSFVSLAGMYAVHAGVAVLCQFAAERGSIYSNNIMTEGVTMSCWLIFMVLLVDVVEECDKGKLTAALILAAVMTDTRKQMAVAYITLFGAMMIARIGRDNVKQYFTRLAILTGGIVLSVIVALSGTRLYNYVLRGEFTQNTRDMNLVLTTSLYVSDKSDSSLIEEEAVRELFTRTMDILDESKSNYSYAGKGWSALEEHYEEHYDVITVDTTGPLFVDYAKERGFAEGLDAEQEADRMSGVIVKSLLWDNLGTYLRVYIASFLNGIINTVAKRNTLLDIYAFAAVILVFIMSVYMLFVKNKPAAEQKRAAGRGGLYVLIAMAVNTGVAAALIFCQSRYMIYNMALFYMAGIWLLENIISVILSARKKQCHPEHLSS